jgi:hypothetical protein
MHTSFKLLLFIISLGLVISSCKKDPEIDVIIQGCTDPLADNHNNKAERDNGSCTYQKRFISQYDINVLCNAASAIFNNAGMEIKENSKKDRVSFNISSLAGNIIFDGLITKDDVTIDTIIQGLVVNAKAINTSFPDEDIKASVTIKSKMTLSSDARKLTGDMNVVISNSEPLVINGLTIPPGQNVTDKCTFTGTKK